MTSSDRSLLLESPHFLQSTVEALHVVSVSSSLQLHCLPFPPVWLQCTGLCCNLQASLHAAVEDLVLLVCNTLWWAWSPLLIRVCSSSSLGVEPVVMFSIWLANICLGCVVYDPLHSSPFFVWCWVFLLLPIGREHCPSPTQSSPYGWWYLVLQCWTWSAYLSFACCTFAIFWKPILTWSFLSAVANMY